ncbi:MAG: hypothetical protein JWO32_1421, partial [Bacteroidetes bacterium]|nr:hypothetical protein [Bacteroidota bacterium]
TSNAVNAPLLTKKGEVKLNATQSDMQIAWAAGKHLGIMANGYFQSYRAKNDYQHRGGMLELGAGYYKSHKDKEHLVFEAYGGAGMGRVYKQEMVMSADNSSQNLASFTANGAKLFVQPGIGLTTDFFDIALTQRLSIVKYTRFVSQNYSSEALQQDYLDNLTKPVFVFVEPAITARAGYKFIKLQAQYGLTLNMSSNIRSPGNFATLGIVVDLK